MSTPVTVKTTTEVMCHHSLVTPIDWKPISSRFVGILMIFPGHHSLVTPIDWKPGDGSVGVAMCGAQSPLAGDTY